ncbi:hypothetical protein VTL71DRAFT_2660 [Oculimacula yallundae]|uniref:Uncharacterized protein n=1 Tax=Oculimacula yallundae TaxID=86028 RepID=A0ABR4CBL7_9HELO
MAGFVGPIPGMYYDSTKNKYFKIQPNSAGPASSAYSSQDVKRRRLRAEKEDEAAREQERRKRRIRRSEILERGLTGGILQREYGHVGFEPASILAGGFMKSEQFPIDGRGVFTITHRSEIGPQTIDIGYINDNIIRETQFDLGVVSARTYPTGVILGLETSTDVTSFSVNESNELRATTFLSSSAHRGIVICGIGEGYMADHTRRPPLLNVGPGTLRGDSVGIFSSTSAPPASDLLFAHGTSAGVLVTSKGQIDTKFVTPPTPSNVNPDDLFAVEFLSDNPSILLSGGRRGVLNLTDLRAPIPSWDKDTITHPSSITHIRQINAHRIIVSGLSSSLCQYDLRYRKEDLQLPSPTRYQKNKAYTRPILSYPEYHNTASHQAGFDIDLESGIVAAAQEADEYHPSVQLFSLHGGHKLASPYTNDFQHNSKDHPTVKCLRFARDSDLQMKSLFVGHPGVITRYAWDHHCSED